MCNEIGNRWFECWQPIGLLDQPSNMEIGLCWYENKNGSMSTYDLTDHIMVELETIIALTTMTYIAKKLKYIYIYKTHINGWTSVQYFIKDK